MTDNGAGIGARSDRVQTNSAMTCAKKYPTDTSFGSVAAPTENCRSGRATSSPSPMLLPTMSKAPVTILPLSCRAATAPRNPAAKTVPKITINSNTLHKVQRAKFQTASAPRTNDIDDDLSNILDIPIIFAKDGDNLGIVEKAPNPGQNHLPISIEPVDNKVKRLGSTTKVVLISNKQDKSKLPSHQGVAQVILQSRSQNTPRNIGTSWNGGLQIQSVSRPNPPAMKYTKIILTKRNYGMSMTNNSSAEKNERMVTSKGPPIVPGFKETTNDDLEIEDAIKTNIIERRFVTIPEIDLTSPTKSQHGGEPSPRTSVARTLGTDEVIQPQSELDG